MAPTAKANPASCQVVNDWSSASRLERAGLVRRAPDPNDRRGLQVTLTETGRQVIEEAAEAGLAVQRRILDTLPPEDQERLGDLLRTLLASAPDAGR